MPRDEDFKAWLYALLFMAAFSAVALIARGFWEPIFNLAFEVSVFYIPTLILFFIVVHERTKRKVTQNEP